MTAARGGAGFRALLASALIALFPAGALGDVGVCPGLRLSEPLDPELSATELALVCGTAEGPWSRIPMNQVKFHLTRFLQDRGHLTPSFQQLGGVSALGWRVEPGPVTKIRGLRFTGVPESKQGSELMVPEVERDEWLGSTLTPARLDAIEGITSRWLQDNGYPCARAVTRVPDPESAFVDIGVEPGPYAQLSSDRIRVATDFPVEGHQRALVRQHAFEEGQSFNMRLLELTARRLESSGFLDNAYFLVGCTSEDGLPVYSLRGVASPPRLLRLAFGFNTEEIAVARASWKHSRLGSQAAEAEVYTEASFIQQELGARLRAYPLRHSPRFSIESSLRTFHADEEPFETIGVDFGVNPGRTFDTSRWTVEVSTGPTFSWTRTIEGPERGSRFQSFLSARLALIGHDFEYHAGNPIDGTFLQADAMISDHDILSGLTIRRFQLSGRHLWFRGREAEPALVHGTRAGFGTLGGDPDIPPEYLFFLGGSDSLRGFGRALLPESGRGARSVIHAGQEIRFPRLVPWGISPIVSRIEPLVFIDAGILGSKAFSLDAPLYFSPGLGVRGITPLLPFRMTIARGYSFAPTQGVVLENGFQLFLGLGEEF